MKYNALLSEFTLIFDHESDYFLSHGEKLDSLTLGLLNKRDDIHFRNISLSYVADSLELYIRRMIEACACTLCIPAHDRSMWAAPQRLKSLLSPSNRKRLKFLDHRQTIWADIQKYLRPVANDIQLKKIRANTLQRMKFNELQSFKSNKLLKIDEPAIVSLLNKTVWDLYLLSIATKNGCETPLSPIRTIQRVNNLMKCDLLSSESKSRLSIVRGLFSLFGDVQEVPGFRYIAEEPHQSLRSRLDEIIEDAYLLEASHLRRFLGIKTNVKSIKRDLRKLVNFIAKNRSWAKGVFAATSQMAALPSIASKTTGQILDAIPGLQGNYSAPALIEPWMHLFSTRARVAISYRKLPFSGKEGGEVLIQTI